VQPFPSERMAMREVGPRVNNARNEGPECQGRSLIGVGKLSRFG